MNSAAPTIVALETNSAWILILVVSIVTFPVVLLLRRLIDRPGGIASGVLLILPLALPVIAGLSFHDAVLPEIAVLRPVGESLLSGAGKGLFDLLVFTDDSGVLIPYALWGSPGPYLLVIGLGVTSFMLLRRVCGAVVMGRLVRRCERVSSDGDLAAAVERIAERAGLKRAPEILLLPPNYHGAFVAAGRRHRLLLARDIVADLQAAELEAVLAHEIAHLRSGDVPVIVASGLLRDVVAWNPIGHLAYRKLASDREFEADRLAAELTGDPLAVASGLLKVYEMTRRRRTPAAAVPFVRRRGRVSSRINRLLALADTGVTVPKTGYAPFVAAAVLVALLGVEVGASIGNRTDSAFAIVVGGPELSDVDLWDATVPTRGPERKGRTEASGEGRSRPLESERKVLLKDPRLSENLAVSVKDVPRWVRTMTRMAKRAGIPKAAVRAEFQDPWRAVEVFSGPAAARVSVYRMEPDVTAEVFGNALR